MTIHRILLVFWSLVATTFGGAITGLFFMENPAVNSLYMRLSDAQTCIENYGTLTCDFHYVVGGRGFALLATGALISVFCSLPTILRFVVRFPEVYKLRLGLALGAGLCMGAVAYVIVNQLGVVGGFLFEDVASMSSFGMLAGLYAWMACMASAKSSLSLMDARG